MPQRNAEKAGEANLLNADATETIDRFGRIVTESCEFEVIESDELPIPLSTEDPFQSGKDARVENNEDERIDRRSRFF